MLKVGDKAPDFELEDQDGRKIKLLQWKGTSSLILYFYPKDDTPGCTAQSCSFRDHYEELQKLDVKIVGVSSDSTESHKRFVEKYKLPFTLLSDPKGEARKLYDVKKTFGLIPARVSFIINPKGMITYAYSSQINIQKHVDDALTQLRGLAEQTSFSEKISL